MSVGISIQHASTAVREDREIRTDHAGFVGLISPTRWPRGASPGDFTELTVDGLAAFEAHAHAALLDPGTRVAVRAFFANGGARCTVWGVCIQSEREIVDPTLVRARMVGLLERMAENDEPALLLMPCLAWLPAEWDGSRRSGRVARVAATEAAVLLLAHCCEVGNRFLLLDAPKDASEELVVAWVRQLRARAGVDPSWGAVYFPWLLRGDTALPPSGAVAGVYARTDLANAPFGVRAAPANQEVRGFTHAAVPLSWKAGTALLEQGVNPVLEQPGRGLAIWGARTMSADPRWAQVTARRIVAYITERVRRDAEWVVFEHQRPELWETVARMVRSRLDAYWSAGLLSGESRGEEYLVQCDAELNPPAVRDAGQVHVKVMLRPTTATEFIEVELQLGV